MNKVIVVDDGSKDKTADIARLAGAEVVQHIQNGGKGSALKTGFKFAEKLNPDVVVCLDADGQHNPDDIPKVIAPILSKEAEMVIASRYLKKEHKKYIPKYRRFGLWVLNKGMNFGSECKITDSQCGFRAFSGDIIGKFNFGQNGLSIESEMLEDAINNKIRIKEVPSSSRYDGLDTSTEKPGKHGLGVLGFIIRTVKDRRPLLFFGVSGAIMLIIGLTLSVYSLSSFFNNGQLPFGPSLAASVLTLMGALCLFSGLILNSISGMIKAQTRLNHRPDESFIENIYEKKNQRLPALNHHPQDLLLGSTNGQKVQGVTISSHNQKGILFGDINGQKVQGGTVLNNYNTGIPFGDIDDHKIQGVTLLNNHPIVMPLEYINGQKVQGVILLNNHRQEISLENFDKDYIPNQTPLNNTRKKTVIEDAEEENVQI